MLMSGVPQSAAAECSSTLPQILGRTTLVSQILTSQAHREGAIQSSQQIWHALEKGSFGIISSVTPAGEPRSSGVM
jgi:hypothetical protein